MIRRTFLKALCASPLGFYSNPESRSEEPSPGVKQRRGDLYDPLEAWASKCARSLGRKIDDTVIRAII